MTVDRDASTDKIFSRKLVKRWNVKHLSLVLATWCAILIIYRSLSLRFGIGDQINPLFAIPILLSGWLFGTWGGVFSTILAALAIIFMSAHANAELSHQIPGILIGLVSGLSSGWISSLWKQLQDQKGQLIGEISIRQSTETALQKLNNDLEGLVASRTVELSQANQQLEASLMERETLLKEIHHRVKNNLQIISSLLNLQAQHILDTESRNAFRESQTRVRSMALMHEKLYRSDNFAKINFSEYVGSLSAYLVQTYRANAAQILLNFRCENISLHIDTAVPMGLILNELISNAFKYAFPDNASGEISIALFMGEDGLCHLVVADNGVGFPAGLNISNDSSLGLQLVNNLVEQIDGQLHITSDQGVRYDIAFKLSS